MKNKKVTMKKLIAAVMSVAVIATSIYFMPQTDASAEDTTVQKQSYGAWKDIVPVNGSFEVGEEGMDVYGWSMISMTSGRKKDLGKYQSAFSLKTVEENGNKVAEFKKTGAGYMAMTSQAIEVEQSQEYRFSFDFKITEIIYDTTYVDKSETDNSNKFFPLHILIEEVAESESEDGTITKTETFTKDIYSGTYFNNVSSNWNTHIDQFVTGSDTDYVVIYFWLGGGYLVDATVRYDNIQLEKNDDCTVINGDFSQVTYEADGGRAEGNPGPAGWTLTGTSATGLSLDTTHSYENQFQATVEKNVDGRDSVVAIKHLGDANSTSSYVALQSPYIQAEAGMTYAMATEAKLVCYDDNGVVDANGTIYKGIRYTLFCYDKNKNYISGGYKHTTQINHTYNADSANDWIKILGANVSSTANLFPEGTAYIRLNLCVAYNTSGTTTNNFTVYFDNVNLDLGKRTENTSSSRIVADQSLGYTQYDCNNAGTLRNTGFYEPYYDIRRVNSGSGYEDAVQLYVTNPTGGYGGTVFYQSAVPVEGGQKYQLQYDVKVEGATSNTSYGPDVVLRYKNTSNEYLNSGNPSHLVEELVQDEWTHITRTVTVPDEATSVEIGLVIGVATKDTCPDLKNSFANIAIAKADDTTFWAEYDKERTETDLLFTMLDTENASTVKDLIDIKKGVGNDMNLSGRINEDDADIMRWKLTGVTKSSELRR